VFAHSRFIENPPDMILGDKPLIFEVVLSQYCDSSRPTDPITSDRLIRDWADVITVLNE
jgi:hypothetical protein